MSRQCLYCGRPFAVHHAAQRFCNLRCFALYGRSKYPTSRAGMPLPTLYPLRRARWMLVLLCAAISGSAQAEDRTPPGSLQDSINKAICHAK
jgi:hypothetical protein